MSADMLVLAALCIPLLIAAGIAAAGRFPNVREGVTVVGSVILLGVVIALALSVARGNAPALDLGAAAPGLSFAFKLEPLGALFALVASGLWIVNSFYSIGYMRGNRERNQTRFYICFAIAIFGALGVAMSGNLFTLFVFYEVLTLSTCTSPVVCFRDWQSRIDASPLLAAERDGRAHAGFGIAARCGGCEGRCVYSDESVDLHLRRRPAQCDTGP